MAGGEYAPNDSRNVTLRDNAPGRPSGWREGDPDGPSDLAPADQRDVTLRRNAPGKPSGWQEGDDAPGKAAVPGTEAADPADPPPGVGDGAPYSAEDAAKANRLDD